MKAKLLVTQLYFAPLGLLLFSVNLTSASPEASTFATPGLSFAYTERD